MQGLSHPERLYDFSRTLRRTMSHITIEVWDATGNKKQTAEVPADAPVNRLIAVLVEKMNLPRQSPDGQMMSYKFHHRASGRQLLDTELLSTAAVRDGDILRLQPEITAGGGRRLRTGPQSSNGLQRTRSCSSE